MTLLASLSGLSPMTLSNSTVNDVSSCKSMLSQDSTNSESCYSRRRHNRVYIFGDVNIGRCGNRCGCGGYDNYDGY